MAETGTRRSVARTPITDDGAPAPATADNRVRPLPMGPSADAPRSDTHADTRTGPDGKPLNAPPWFGGGSGSGGSRAGRKTRWIWIAVGLVVVLGVLWFLIPHTPAPQNNRGGGGRGGFQGNFAGGGQATTINMATVGRGDIPLYLDALGTVTPVANVTVRSQISGQLTSVAYQEGQMVRQGQLLAQIDARPYQQQRAQALGVLARDEAQLANARLDLQRYQTLLAQDSIARQQVDTQAATVRQLEGAIASDRASVGAADLNIAYARIVAPITGRVGLRPVDPGNYVSTGDTNGVATITQINPIDVLFNLAEDQLPQVASRMRSGAVLPVTVFDRAQKTQLSVGRLMTLDNRIDPTTGTLRAKARFDNAGGVLFPQQFVNVRILVDTLHNTVLVPSTAVLRGSNGLFVYVIRPDRTVTVQNVVIGPVSGQQTAITSGLEPGQRVVTDGSDRLREGAKVILPGDCIPASQGGQNAQAGGNRRGQGGQGGGQGGAPKGAQGGQDGAAKGAHGGFQRGQGGAGGPVRTAVNGKCPAGMIAAGFQGGATSAAQAQPGGPTASPAGPDAPAGQGFERGQGAGGQGQGGGQQGLAMLDVLGLDASQQARAETIFAAERAKARPQAEAATDPAARGQIFRQANMAALAQIEPMLRPDQKAKLAEVRGRMQSGGQRPNGQAGGQPGGFAGGLNRGFGGGAPAAQ